MAAPVRGWSGFLAALLAVGVALSSAGCTSPAKPATPTPRPNPWPGGVEPAFSTSAQLTVEQLTSLARGLPADVDGDGFAEYRRTYGAGGTIRTEILRAGATEPVLVSTQDPAGNLAVTVDADLNGTVDATVDLRVGPPYRRVTTGDASGDGVVDERITDTYDFTAGTRQQVVESRVASAWVQVSTSTVPLGRAATEDECTDHGLHPRDWPSGDVVCLVGPIPRAGFVNPGDGGNLCVRVQGDASNARACATSMLPALKAAADCVLSRGMGAGCLPRMNPAAADALARALTTRHVEISCGNRCPNERAQEAPVGGDPDDRHISLNPADWEGASDAGRCEILMHELLHSGELPDGACHNCGLDQVYSCARYCSGYVDPQVSAHSDCVQCAKTAIGSAACYDGTPPPPPPDPPAPPPPPPPPPRRLAPSR